MTLSPARTSSVAVLVDESTEDRSDDVEGIRDVRENVGSDEDNSESGGAVVVSKDTFGPEEETS